MMMYQAVAPFFILLFFMKDSFSSLAITKCKEYAKAVYVEENNPTLTRRSKTTPVSECGIVSVPLIIGGIAAKETEFPHMAAIGYRLTPQSEVAWNCGGSLISENYVVTAAHCVESRELGLARLVRLGTINLDSKEYQQIPIAERIPHPEYKTPNKANDIALLKLQSKVKFSPYIRPACLNTKPVSNETKAMASGFGKLAYDAESGSQNLMKVALNIYENDECSKALSARETIDDRMICAGQMSGGKDTCQGDSGGPLQIVLDEPYCMYSIIGVTSFGKFCGFANSPAVYTRVSSFVPWIENIVWK